MKVLILALIFSMVLSVSGILSAQEKVKLEHRLSAGDKIVSEATTQNHVWADFRQLGGPLFDQTGNVETTTTIDIVSVDESGVIEIKGTSKISGAVKQSGDDGEPKTTLIMATEYPLQTLKVTKAGRVVWSDISEYKHRHPQNPLRDIDYWLTYITVQQFPPLVGLPDKETAVGEIWTVETPLKGPDGRELKMITNSRLFALGRAGKHDCAWIQSNTKLPFKIEFSGDFEGYSSIAVEGMCSWEGRYYFAYEEGRMIKDRSSWHLEMMIQIPTQEGIAKGFIITLGDSTLTTSLPEQTPKGQSDE